MAKEGASMRLRIRSAVLALAILGGATLASASAVAATTSAPASVSAAVSSAVSASAGSLCPGAVTARFGPDVCVFRDTMSQATIQADLNAVAARQVPLSSQFDSQRYALLFAPGTYGSAADPLVFQVGYYTQVAGLGELPSDTVINGAIDVFNDLCAAGTGNCNADDNFWRSLSNLKLNVHLPAAPPAYVPAPGDPDGPGCENSTEIWAVSQAAPIRRAIINGSVAFQDYCANKNFASGGFIADSQISGHLNFYGNQQYLVRNSSIGGATACPGGLWNMVYSGVKGAPAPVFKGECEQNTVLAASPVTEEAPFLVANKSGAFSVFVPAAAAHSAGISWARGTEAGSAKSLSAYFIADPATPVAVINRALAAGKSLVLTPGVYSLPAPITVKRTGTTVLGLGFATLVPTRGNAALVVTPNAGVKVSGLIVDAGAVKSPVLVTVGTPGRAPGARANPDLLADVFFRIGGAEKTRTSATVSLRDNAGNSIIDDVWAWRADHGNDVGWTKNTAATGVQVTGSGVTAYGLAVEHYQKSEVVWTGQGGTEVFFQNELPYDAPAQTAWNESASFKGYPAFQLGTGVKTFQGYGMGSYVVFIDTPATLHVTEAFQVPRASGVRFRDTFGVWIGGGGGLNSIIGGKGGPVTGAKADVPVDVASYS
jgi:hypothetical protein